MKEEIKTILNEFIGEDKEITCDPTHLKTEENGIKICSICSLDAGKNEAKAELREKVDEISEKILEDVVRRIEKFDKSKINESITYVCDEIINLLKK